MSLHQIIAHDRRISRGLAQGLRGRLPRAAAWVTARTGDSWLWLLMIAGLFWRGQALAWNLLTSVMATALIVFVCKGIFRRERPSPSRLAVSSDRYAFPSGHAARAGALAVTLAAAYPQSGLLWLLWALLVSLARVALARHYLSDVLGGLMLGIFISAILQWAVL